MIRKATAMKEKYLRVVAIQATLDDRILSDVKYERARNPCQENRFIEAKKKLADAVGQHEFSGWWLTNDLAVAKDLHGANLSGLLERFLGISDAVTTLEGEQSRFQKMHRASQ